MWYDEHLFRTGAMNRKGVVDIVVDWFAENGFEIFGGKTVFDDFCIIDSLSEANDWERREWLEINHEKSIAYLKGTDPDGLVYRMLPVEHLRVVGAMIGDIASSGYEWRNIKHKYNYLICYNEDHFTDDTVLTYATALGMIEGMKKIDRSAWMNDEAMQSTVERETALSLKRFARKYPRAGYGGAFKRWVENDSMEPYGSWGNGSAMRVSFAGWYADSLEEAKLLGRVSARCTHSHPEVIKGAEAVAGCIYLLRTGHAKEEIREYASGYYDIDFTLDEIRPSYKLDVSRACSVPQAIAAFLENDSFEDVIKAAIKAAISIGGYSDTIAIAGSIAEACYPVPSKPLYYAWNKLDVGMQFAAKTVNEVLRQNRPN
jgi:type I restriction enzyme M protein